MEKKNFIMAVGLPAVGKSTYITVNNEAIIAKYGTNILLSSDDVILDVAESLNKTYSEVFQATIGPATRYVESMLEILALSKKDFILDQTNLTRKSRVRKLSLLKNSEQYNKIAVVFKVEQEMQRERLANRGGKVIPVEVIEKMEASYEEPELSEGFDQVISIEDFTADLIKFAEEKALEQETMKTFDKDNLKFA